MPFSSTEGAIPIEGVSYGGGGGASERLSFLNADWVNRRVLNVTRRVEELLTRLIDYGLLSAGYPPFEYPVTDEMLKRMTPEEFVALFNSLTSLQQKAELLARMQALKLG
jgi:hypothetical protein